MYRRYIFFLLLEIIMTLGCSVSCYGDGWNPKCWDIHSKK